MWRSLLALRIFHFWDSADLYIIQPEASSKSLITRSTSLNSHREVMAGFRS